MARIRTIKPEFWKSESIAQLTMQTRLTFIGLWTYVDDNGVGRDNIRLIAAEIYPLEEDPRETLATVSRGLQELERAGRVTRFTHSGRAFLHVTGWDEHQKIDKPNKPRYPLPTDPGSNVLTCDDAQNALPFEEPSRQFRDTFAQPPRLEQGSKGTREQGTGSKGEVLPAPTSSTTAAPETESEGQRINRLTRVFTDAQPMSNFPAVAGVVRKAVKAGRYPDTEIVDALTRLAADGRSVTVDTLRIELDGLPAQRQAAKKPSTTDARVAAVDDVVASLMAKTGSDLRAIGGAA